MNIVQTYRHGIRLVPGRYDIEISHRDYATHRQWYELQAGDRVLNIELKPQSREQLSSVAPVTPAPQPAPAQATAAAKARSVRDRLRDGSPGPVMVRIPAGCFQMGSPGSETGRNEDERQHRVCVQDFYLALTEVTFAAYDRFATATDRAKPGDEGWGRGNRPVINVSWIDALAYAEWLSQQTGQTYRLPTEAEWEYAARGNRSGSRYWGDNSREACRYANVYDRHSSQVNKFSWEHHDCDDSYATTAPVGQFEANPFGLFDMLGNVWEWTCSGYSKDYDGGENRCLGNNQSPVLRGGSWFDRPDWVRSADRDFIFTTVWRNVSLGFRLAR